VDQWYSIIDRRPEFKLAAEGTEIFLTSNIRVLADLQCVD